MVQYIVCGGFFLAGLIFLIWGYAVRSGTATREENLKRTDPQRVEEGDRETEEALQESSKPSLQDRLETLGFECSASLTYADVNDLNEDATPNFVYDDEEHDQNIVCGICGNSDLCQIFEGDSTGCFEGYLGMYCMKCGHGKCVNQDAPQEQSSRWNNLFLLLQDWEKEPGESNTGSSPETTQTTTPPAPST